LEYIKFFKVIVIVVALIKVEHNKSKLIGLSIGSKSIGSKLPVFILNIFVVIFLIICTTFSLQKVKGYSKAINL